MYENNQIAPHLFLAASETFVLNFYTVISTLVLQHKEQLLQSIV